MAESKTRFLNLIFAAAIIGTAVIFIFGCKPKEGQFSGDRAYKHVEALVHLGPRFPGGESIENARVYIEKSLKEFGWKTVRQAFNDQTPTGSKRFVNVRARFPSGVSGGIDWKNGSGILLLCSHYDTKIIEGVHFVGANDGGSSSGVLLEIARAIATESEIALGIEFVFFDGEEAVIDFTATDGLYGSRYYAKYWRSAPIGKKPQAAYVLDLVGDKKLRIDPPYDSPPRLLSELYTAAEELGHRSIFSIYSTPITDDHVSLNGAGIPALNVIDARYISRGRWHTSGDNMNTISARSLGVVGEVMLQLLKNRVKQEN